MYVLVFTKTVRESAFVFINVRFRGQQTNERADKRTRHRGRRDGAALPQHKRALIPFEPSAKLDDAGHVGHLYAAQVVVVVAAVSEHRCANRHDSGSSSMSSGFTRNTWPLRKILSFTISTGDASKDRERRPAFIRKLEDWCYVEQLDLLLLTNLTASSSQFAV